MNQQGHRPENVRKDKSAKSLPAKRCKIKEIFPDGFLSGWKDKRKY